jgi:multidrug efflux pump subunit AcrB/ABC-type multidrug transport system ATPase subunit
MKDQGGITGYVAQLAIGRPVTTVMVFLALGLLGILSYRALPVQLMPNIALPQIYVQASYPGASPDTMENDILRVLEGELAQVGGIEEISASASAGQAFVTLSFERGTDLDFAELRLEQRLTAARNRLPEQAFAQLLRFDTSQFSNFVMQVSFRGDADLEAMKTLADDSVVPILSSVDGVVQVDATGGASKQVGVFMDPDRAQARGVSVQAVRSAMAGATRPVEGVGDVLDGGRRLPVTLDGRAKRIADVAQAPVDAAGKVRLSHVADIIPGLAGSTNRYRVNGQVSVGLQVYKDQQSNLIRVARSLRERIDAFNSEHEGEGFSLAIDFDAADVIEDNLATLLERAATGAILSLLVLLIFLRGIPPSAVLLLGVLVGGLTLAGYIKIALVAMLAVLLLVKKARPVLVVALAAPASLLIACDLFRWGGLTLNILTLLGLALSIGMLLDNAIVVLESIATRRQAGDEPLEAARRGATLVQRAILAGTLTTIVVFLPLFLIETDMSPLLRELALAVTFPLAASLFVAVALVPVIVSKLGGAADADDGPTRLPGEKGLPRPDVGRSLYSVAVRVVLRSPGNTVGVCMVLVLGSLVYGLGGLILNAEVARPPEDRIQMSAKLPEGSTDDATDEVARILEGLADELPEVDEVQATVRDETATVTVIFKEADERTGPVSIDRARERLKKQSAQVEAAEVEVDPPPATAGGGNPFDPSAGTRETVRVLGPGGPVLEDVARRVEERLEQVPGLTRIVSDLAGSQPTLEIRADRQRLGEYGLSTFELMSVVWATRREGESARYPFRLGDEDVDLVLWVEEEGKDERTIEDLRSFPLTTRSGARIPLSAVATVTTGSEPPEIRRWQRGRTVTLGYGFDRAGAAAANETRQAVDAALAGLSLPSGYYIDVEHADESLSVMWKMLGLAFVLVVIVLSITFESVLQPLLIAICVPLAAVPGVLLALTVTGTPVNQFVALAGIVLLGVVVNNGVLLVDRFQALIHSGSRRPAAIMRASQERLRPVLMTATTTIVGMIPLAVDTGGQNEIWPPFARAVIGGLVASTLISLLLVPAGVLLIARVEDVFRKVGLWGSLICIGLGVLACRWLFVEGEIVVSMAMRIFVAPFVVMAFVGVGRVIRYLVSGESPPDLIGEGAVDLQVRKARKVYGGPPGPVHEFRRVRRWREMAEAAGLAPQEIDTPREGRRSVSWQLLLLGLLGYLHALSDSTWGLLLLSFPTLLLLDAAIGSALQSIGRPASWPLAGWAKRLWRVAQAGALIGYLYLRLRPGEAADVVLLALVGVVAGVWALAHLLTRGGLLGLLGRLNEPEPVVALDGVDLHFENGLYGLLGPNGAGKSTIMRLMVNLYLPTRGQVSINGHELGKHAASLQPRIGFLPQFFGVPPRLTAREYLHHQALLANKIDGKERRELVDSVLAEVGLSERADELLGGYSGGMRQRVGIARTLLNVPRIVVVDEPTVGLDPRERIRFRNLLGELAKTRIVLLSTHVVEDIGSSCREVVVLDRGTLVYRGTPTELVATADGRAWQLDVAESQVTALQAQHRIVSTTRLPGGLVRARGVGEPAPGAELVQPTLEDAYLLMLGRPAEGEKTHAA